MGIKILSWNVNGIRAVFRKCFIDWLEKESPDILCCQELKAQPDQLGKDFREPENYHCYWDWGERKGYSGVATFSKEKSLRVQNGFGIKKFDEEGRTIVAEYPDFILFNVYFPNGKASEERLSYKMEFYNAFLDSIEPLQRQGKKLIVCGDFNTAHHEIDLARPKQNENISGFLPEERSWMDKFEEHGFVDSFRHLNKEPGHYTWWDLKSRARERNVGWRIDYFFVSSNLIGLMSKAFIMYDVMGSDHAPIGIELSLD